VSGEDELSKIKVEHFAATSPNGSRKIVQTSDPTRTRDTCHGLQFSARPPGGLAAASLTSEMAGKLLEETMEKKLRDNLQVDTLNWYLEQNFRDHYFT
jgi:hypothetical protein